MTRIELLRRLAVIRDKMGPGTRSFGRLENLIKDIEADGVLDVQCPSPEIAAALNLPINKR